MKPPIPSPSGEKFEDSRFDFSLLPLQTKPFRASILVLLRLAFKHSWSQPLALAIQLLIPFITIVPPFLALGFFDWRIPFYFLFSYLVTFALFFSASTGAALLMFWFVNRKNGAVARELSAQGVRFVTKTNTTEIPWEKIRKVISWGDDILIRGPRKTLLVPREVFDSPLENARFLRVARELHRRAKSQARALK